METKINKDKINKAIRKVDTSLSNTHKHFQKNFNTLDKKSKEAMLKAFYELECAANTLKSATFKTWSQTRDSLDCAADAANKAANNCKKQIRKKWTTLPSRAKRSIAQSVATLQQSVRDLRRAIVSTITMSISAAKNKIKKATNQTITAANNLQMKAKAKMRSSKPQMKQKLGIAVNNFRKASTDLKKATAIALVAAHEKFSRAANFTLQAAKRLQNNVQESFQAIQPNAKKAVNKAIKDLKYNVESLKSMVTPSYQK